MALSQPLILVQLRLDALEEEVLVLLKDLQILKQKYQTDNQQQNRESQNQGDTATMHEEAYTDRNSINAAEDSHSQWYEKQLSQIENLERKLHEQRARSEEINMIPANNIEISRNVCCMKMQRETSESIVQSTWNVNHQKDPEDEEAEDRHIQLLELHCRELCHCLAGEKHIIELMSQLGEVRFQRLQLEKRLAELEVEMLKQGCNSSQQLTDKLQTYREENTELRRDLTMEREHSKMLRHQVVTLSSELSELKQQHHKLEEEKVNLMQQVTAEKQKMKNAIAEGNKQDALLNDQSNLIRKLQQQVAHLEGKIKRREKELCFITGKGSADDMIKCEALLQAAWAGNVKETKLQLESGADAHCRNYVAQTPLHLAAGNGHTDLCALLLDHGAVVDPRDLWQNTPLHFAACNGHKDTVSLLLDRGAKSHARNRDGRTPKDWAVLCKHGNITELFDKKGNKDEKSDKKAYDKPIIVNENVEEKSLNKHKEDGVLVPE